MGKRNRRKRKGTGNRKNRPRGKKRKRNKKKERSGNEFLFHQVVNIQEFEPPQKKRKIDTESEMVTPVFPQMSSSIFDDGENHVTIDENLNQIHTYEQNMLQYKEYDLQIQTVCPVCNLDTDNLETVDAVMCDCCCCWLHGSCAKMGKLSLERLQPFIICRKCKYGVYDSKKRKKGQFGKITHRFIGDLIDDVKVNDKEEVLWAELDKLWEKVKTEKYQKFGDWFDDFFAVFDSPPPSDNIEQLRFEYECMFDVWKLSRRCSIGRLES